MHRTFNTVLFVIVCYNIRLLSVPPTNILWPGNWPQLTSSESPAEVLRLIAQESQHQTKVSNAHAAFLTRQ